jgi:carbamoyltransferase
VPFARPVDLAEATAKELAAGAIVGWFQGRMEAGPRALGQRSVLADPRSIEARDRINQVIKYREKWRPFCPSIAAETAGKYFERYCDAPFMCIAFDATDALKKDAPAIVHVDGTARVQIVHQEDHPLFHRLIAAFARETGVPVLLNTSFNVKGEPIVHDIHDAIRMFFSTAMDVLVAGPFMVHKNRL